MTRRMCPNIIRSRQLGALDSMGTVMAAIIDIGIGIGFGFGFEITAIVFVAIVLPVEALRYSLWAKRCYQRVRCCCF